MTIESIDYKIITYRPEYRQQVLELQKHHLSEDTSVSKAYLEWKYDENPYLDRNYLYVVFEQSKVIAMVGAYGTKWHWGDPTQGVVLPCFSDLVIHPEWRNQGVFPHLMKFALHDLAQSEFDYALDMSAMSDVAASLMLHGWRTPGFMQIAEWRSPKTGKTSPVRKLAKRVPLATSAYHWVRKRRAPVRLDQSESPLSSLGANEQLPESEADVMINDQIMMTQELQIEPMVSLIKRIEISKRIQHVRDEAFFSWRFQNPLSSYRFLYYRSALSTEIDGYLVLQTSRWSGRSTNIVEWAATGPQVFADLLKCASELDGIKGVNLWSTSICGSFRDVLVALGFKFVNKSGTLRQDLEKPTMLVRSITANEGPKTWSIANRSLLDMESWDLYMANSDNY